MLFGARKPGSAELDGWRDLIAELEPQGVEGAV